MEARFCHKINQWKRNYDFLSHSYYYLLHFISHNLDFVYLNFEKKKTSEFNIYIYAINMSFNSHKKQTVDRLFKRVK